MVVVVIVLRVFFLRGFGRRFRSVGKKCRRSNKWIVLVIRLWFGVINFRKFIVLVS